MLSCLLLASPLLAPAPALQDPSPPSPALVNGGFEQVAGDQPAGWWRAGWNGHGEQLLEETGRSGRAVAIRSDDGADIAWSQQAAVLPFSRYRLSGWVRTEGVLPVGGAFGALLNVHGMEARTRGLVGDNPWTELTVEFDTGPNDVVQVNCLFGGWGLATGRAVYDDLRLELLDRGALPAPRITVDAAAVGEPISEYVYGQFIEHLGRCIYGGIWAEMLEDRKFWYAVDAEESPWRSSGAVDMDREHPFAGEQSVRMRLSADRPAASIEQRGIGLVGGRDYVGRVVLKGTRGVEGVEVSLGWGDAPEQRVAAELHHDEVDSPVASFRLTAGGAAEDGFLRLTARGTSGELSVGTLSLMPADHVRGFRPDVLALLRRLDSPVYRWPGGNFVSGYDWRDGIGPRDRRPPRKNPAWQGVEHNDVGVHEFLDLCELLGTEPYIAVNTGLGSVESAVQELEYLNGAPDTPMGRLRAQNGRAEPWGVRFLGIGNEMYGSWQLGNVPLAQYTQRHNAFVDAMREVDPDIVVIGVGAVGEWSRTMLRDCADRLDHLSEHVYWQERPGLLAHVLQAPASLRRTAEAHRAYRRELASLRGRDIRICEDEWNYWYGPHVFGELGTRYFQKDALGVAAGLHEFGRNSDLYFMANYAQTVNVIGAIKATDTAAAMETTGLVLELYRKRFGTLPCATETSPTLDALAAWSADRSRLTLGVVNPTLAEATVELELSGARLGDGTAWVLAAPPQAFNDPEGARPVAVEERPAPAPEGALVLPPCSVVLYSFPASPAPPAGG